MPWLLATGWIGLAAAQEPRMLRTFGIHLTTQATWFASVAVACVAASSLPSSRRITTYLSSIYIVTSIVAMAMAAWMVVMEWVRGAPIEFSRLVFHCAAFVWIMAPLVLSLSVAVASRSRIALCFLLVVLALAMTLAVHGTRGVWSAPQLAASIASFVSSAALAHVYCRKTA